MKLMSVKTRALRNIPAHRARPDAMEDSAAVTVENGTAADSGEAAGASAVTAAIAGENVPAGTTGRSVSEPPLFRARSSTLLPELARMFGSVPVHDYCSRRFSVFSAWQRGGNIYPAGFPLQDLPFSPGAGITGRRGRAEVPAAGNAGGAFSIHGSVRKIRSLVVWRDCSCSRL